MTDFSDNPDGHGEVAISGDAGMVLVTGSSPLSEVELWPATVRFVKRRRGNKAPALSAPGRIVIAEGETSSITLSATDPDRDRLTFHAERVPVLRDYLQGLGELDHAMLDDHGDGTARLSFTPRYNEAGTYPLRLAVFDEGGAIDVVETALVIEDTLREGDANCDGRIGADDLAALIHALFAPGATLHCVTADSNGEGRVTVSDVTSLLVQLTSSL